MQPLPGGRRWRQAGQGPATSRLFASDWHQAGMPKQSEVSKLAVIAGEIKSKQGALNEVFYKYYVF